MTPQKERIVDANQPEDFVCTLKQAKEFHRIGIGQHSEYYWKVNEIQACVVTKKFKEHCERFIPTINKFYSAFTGKELATIVSPMGKFKNKKQ